MGEILCHLLGDYVLQNHWMANSKTRSWFAALVHAAFYTLPFLVLTQDWRALVVIGGTHAVIDRHRLAALWVNFWGVGVEGRVIGMIMRHRGYLLGEVLLKPDVAETRWVRRDVVGWFEDVRASHGDAEAYAMLVRNSVTRTPDAPPFLGVWLLIIVDNTLHLCINHLVLGAA